MCCAVVVLGLLGCKREEPAAPPPKETPPARPGKPLVDANGNIVAPRTVLAATRGGEAVLVAISSAERRACADLFGESGISLQQDEVLVQLQLARPLFDRAAAARAAGRPRWSVVSASWPGGISSGGDAMDPVAKPRTAVEMPDDLATRGGTLRLRFDGLFQVGTASPRATLALDGTFDVLPCGDRAVGALPDAQPIQVRAEGRAFAIRGARVTPTDRGPRVELSTRPRQCPTDRLGDPPGDLEISLTVEGDRSSHVVVHGDLVGTSLNESPGGYRVIPEGGWEGTGRVRVALDGDGSDYAPLAIHGHVLAERCPPAR
jgi:hypothetical protein